MTVKVCTISFDRVATATVAGTIIKETYFTDNLKTLLSSSLFGLSLRRLETVLLMGKLGCLTMKIDLLLF